MTTNCEMLKEFKQLVQKYGVTKLLGSDGSCACGELYLFGIKIKVHCHKTTIDGRVDGCKCRYAGVHITPDVGIEVPKKELTRIALLFANYIKKSYCCEVDIVVEP